jgi:hypothetical protein
VKRIAILVALCLSLICTPVHAKTFVGVLYPLFGPGAAIGIVELVDELKMMPDAEVSTYLHQSWPSLVEDIDRQPPGTHIVVIGYSLGANNSVLVANQASYVDLIIALQPSMLTSTPPVSKKVGRMIEIYNPNPWMTFGGMGSQKLVGDGIEYVVNNDSHPGAQFNSQFRNLVKSEVAKFVADDLQAAQPEIPRQVTAGEPRRLATPKPTEEWRTHQIEAAPKEHSQFAQDKTPKLPEPVKPEHVAAEQPKQQPEDLTAFQEHRSYGNSLEIVVPRQLTIGDMKDYVLRTYHDLSPPDLIAASKQTRRLATAVGTGE